MKKLVIVRHGSYGEEGSLNAIGKGSIKTLAEKLSSVFEGKQVVVFTSGVRRALESAEIIADSVDTRPVIKMFLSGKGSLDEADQVIGHKAPADVVVLVTHKPEAAMLARRFGKMLGTDFPRIHLECAEAHLFDWEKRTWEHVSAL